MDDDEQAVQTRCPRCDGEQWALNVIYFSRGESGCTVCGQRSTPMTHRQWIDALAEVRQQWRTSTAKTRRYAR